MRRQRRRELRPPIGSTELPSIQRLDTWILRYGPPGDTPSAPRLRWQLWALRPGLDGASRPSTTLTGRGGIAGFGARRTGTAVSGLQPVSARPTAPGGNRRRRPLPRACSPVRCCPEPADALRDGALLTGPHESSSSIYIRRFFGGQF